ncbi:MAG: FAD:protein FMN transferase [Gammaproteobacteria bacterium]|nr:FAD:protein FMN transferase [Gammaproteobacteria bacterium]
MRFALKGLLLVLAATLAACAPQQAQDELLALDGRTMGTYWSVRIAAPPADLDAEALREDLEAALIEVNAQMSNYDPESEISRFNRSPVGEWFAVSAELAEVMAAAREVSARSDGAFDVTVGPLVNLWGFGPRRVERDRVPDEAAIEAARARVDWRQIEVRQDPPALRRQAEVTADLGGIAKGHGADVMTAVIESHGATRYLADIGGDMRGRGHNARGVPWQVGVEVPALGRRGGVQAIIAIDDVAVTTSGDYRNYFVHEGRRYSHTIDPKTGWPIEQRVASVTVLHASAMWSDGWATALNVMGPESGLALARELSLPVLFILYTDSGLEEVASPEFSAFRVAGDP